MNQQLSDFQRRQAEEKALQRENDLLKEMTEAKMIQDAIENDEKMFNTYAKRCLDEWDHQVPDLVDIRARTSLLFSSN